MQSLLSFLANIERDCGALLAQGIFPSVPDLGIPGQSLRLTITSDEAKRFGDVVKGSLSRARQALDDDFLSSSAAMYREILKQIPQGAG